LNDNTFLLDSDFLRLLDQEREKEVFVKIISLDFEENTLEEIEGRVTQGSISIDGTSSVRRTCSLSLVASELNIHEFYWGLNTKFRLLTGVKNTVKQRYPYNTLYSNYPDICWFNMGTYIISSFNTSQSTNQYTISIQGKDKMCLLNGEVGGLITPLSWDFGKIDTINSDGSISHDSYLIKDIILEAVHEHAQEPYWNIVINDLDDCGLELLEYRGKEPMYLLCQVDNGIIKQISFNFQELAGKGANEKNFIFDPRISRLDKAVEIRKPDIIVINGHKFTIMKAEYGDTIGYRTTDLTYAGELISNLGESVTSMLDKIVQMLGDFEYFYDLDGRFVFQRKKIYLKSTFSPITENDSTSNEFYIKNIVDASAYSYSFDNSLLVTSFSNNPDFNNLKNDFSIWGVKKGVSGIEIPIHLRYAIDTKPWYYKNYNQQVYITEDGITQYKKITNNNSTANFKVVDWRELIYQMSLDYNKYHHDDDFLIKIDQNNSFPNDIHLYLKGYTGYELYYIDINGFWRDIYNPDYTFTYEVVFVNKKEFNVIKSTLYTYDNCLDYSYDQACSYMDAKEQQFYSYDYRGQYKLVSITKEEYEKNPGAYSIIRNCANLTFNSNAIYMKRISNQYNKKNYWLNNIQTNPEGLNFWFDFLDTDGDLGKYKVSLIGDRTKTINDNKIKSIYFRDVPSIIFVDRKTSIETEQEKKGSGYAYLQVNSSIENLFSMSSQGKSALDVLDEWLYSYTYCTESINLNVLPIYYLEPNTRIMVHDNNSGINGEYIITRLNIPLGYGGTMSITATKAVENLY